MSKSAAAILLALGLASAAPAYAAPLAPGATAPDFSATATMAGKTFQFNLDQALKSGPVVLYFYPAAFTAGCTIEAHDFATAMPAFHALHATVIGVSMDGVAILKKFSVSDCRSRFPVASDKSGAISRSFHAVMPGDSHYADRISYVIAPNHKIIATYRSENPDHHVATTMAAVKAWDAKHPPA
jgi:peroxiredoxin